MADITSPQLPPVEVADDFCWKLTATGVDPSSPAVGSGLGHTEAATEAAEEAAATPARYAAEAAAE